MGSVYENKNMTARFTEDLASAFWCYFNDDFSEFKPISKNTILALINNGNTITSDNPIEYNSMLSDASHKYYIAYITGVKANTGNLCFDYAQAGECKILYIFLDYFSTATRTPGNPDDKMDFGNAVIFDQITKLTRVFQDTCLNHPSEDILPTIYGSCLRLNPYIVAAFVTNIIRPIEPVDVEGCPLRFEDLQSFVQSGDSLIKALNGIRWDDYEESMQDNRTV